MARTNEMIKVISNWPVEIHRDQVREMVEHRYPLVSVIVIVYNGQETVCQAIDSALKQTYLEREIIVVDDGSTDSSVALLRGYGRRIQLIQQKHRGISITRNTGLRAARGEYIAFLDQDDTWIPEKLQLQVEILKKYPSVGLTCGNFEFINKKREKLGSTPLSSNLRHSPSWEDLLKWNTSPLIPSFSLWRKELMTKSGGFDTDFITPGYEDRDFFLRLREITDFHYLDISLGNYSFDEARTPRWLANLLLYARKQWNNPRLQNQANDTLRDDFVRICASNLQMMVRLLLKLEQNKVSKEMLDRLNGFHDSFKNLFGDSYKRVTGLEPIDLNQYELYPVSSVLLFLYLIRPDLQIAYPEVRTGDLHRLIVWGASVAMGDYKDGDRPILVAYCDELLRLRKSTALSNLRQLWAHAWRQLRIINVIRIRTF
jgi:glycosyltransferase involved in cell wall biosynthesis